MSTAQLISELKALPTRERVRVIRAVMPAAKRAVQAASKKAAPNGKVTWPDRAEMKRKVFGGRILSNLVLLEREEARY